ncbi:hypothetical protein QE152_g40420 [Popillia japonica]|uniref:Secreted protein n=1 Tax=Popillia japonica TaxID=7064 RepID=A0AAW1HRG9_POPJA
MGTFVFVVSSFNFCANAFVMKFDVDPLSNKALQFTAFPALFFKQITAVANKTCADCPAMAVVAIVSEFEVSFATP